MIWKKYPETLLCLNWFASMCELSEWIQLSGKLSRLKSKPARKNVHASRLHANGSKIRFSISLYIYCNFCRVCLPSKMASETMKRSIALGNSDLFLDLVLSKLQHAFIKAISEGASVSAPLINWSGVCVILKIKFSINRCKCVTLDLRDVYITVIPLCHLIPSDSLSLQQIFSYRIVYLLIHYSLFAVHAGCSSQVDLLIFGFKPLA